MLTLIDATTTKCPTVLFFLILALSGKLQQLFFTADLSKQDCLSQSQREVRKVAIRPREPSDFCLAWKQTAKIPLLFGSWKALKQKHNQ